MGRARGEGREVGWWEEEGEGGLGGVRVREEE